VSGISRQPSIPSNAPNIFTKEFLPVKKVFHKSNNFKEAEEWDMIQHVRLTPEQRQKAAAELKKRVFGDEVRKIREVRKEK